MDPADHARQPAAEAARTDAEPQWRLTVTPDDLAYLDGAVVELYLHDDIFTAEIRIPGPAAP